MSFGTGANWRGNSAGRPSAARPHSGSESPKSTTRTSREIREGLRLLRQNFPAAVRRLHALVCSTNEQVALGAIRLLCDRLLGPSSAQASQLAADPTGGDLGFELRLVEGGDSRLAELEAARLRLERAIDDERAARAAAPPEREPDGELYFLNPRPAAPPQDAPQSADVAPGIIFSPAPVG